MPNGAIIKISWALDIVDRGGPARLIRDDQALRSSLKETDGQYRRLSSTAVGAAAQQEKALRRTTAAAEKAGDAAQKAALQESRAALTVERAQTRAAAATQRYGTESLQARTAALKLAEAENRLSIATRKTGEAAATAASQQAAASRRSHATAAAAERDAATRRRTAGRIKSGVTSTAATVGGGYALISGARAVVGQTVGFDKELRNVNSIAQVTDKRLQGIGTRLLELGGRTGQAPKNLAAGMYDLVSSSFSAGQSLRILRASSRAATAGLTDTATSTSAVAAVLNAYHRPAKDAANVSDVLFQTVNKGVISFEDLAQNIGSVLPFASQLGVNIDQVGAAFSTLTKTDSNPAEVATKIRGMLTGLIKPSEAAAVAIRKTGAESGEALIKQKGLQGALEALIGTTDGSKQAIAKLFPDVRGLAGALGLTGKNTRTARKDLDSFGKSAQGATSRALSQQSKSLSYQWDRLTASASGLAIKVGQQLLPSVAHAIPAVIGFVHGMTDGKGAGGDFANTLGDIGAGIKTVGSILIPVVKATGEFAGEHPGLLKLAGGFLAVAAAVKAIKFAGAITGVSGLLRGLRGLRTEAVTTSEAVAAASTGTVAPGGRLSRARTRIGRIGRGAVGVAGVGIIGAQVAGGAIGGTPGAVIGGAGSGAATGALVGSAIPGVGTAVGAIGGAVIGGLASYFSKHKADVQKSMLDVLTLKGSSVRLNVGKITVPEDVAKKYADAIKKARDSAERLANAQDGKGIGSARLPQGQAKLAAEVKANYTKAGTLAVKAFESGVEGGARLTTGRILVKGFTDQIKNIHGPGRDAAAREMVEYARGLQEQGRLPKRELSRVIKSLGATYDIGVAAAGESGKKADRAIVASIRTGKTRAAAEKLVRSLQSTYAEMADDLPEGVKLGADNTESVLKRSMGSLRTQIKTLHGSEREEAQQHLQELVGIYRLYSRRMKSESIASSEALAAGVLRNLRNMASGVTGIYESIPTTVGPQGLPGGSHAHHKRRGGLAGTYAEGGLVPILASGGEMIVDQGRTMMVPGPSDRDGTLLHVRPGAAVITGHGQQLMSGGASLEQTLAHQLPHFALGGRVPDRQIAGLAKSRGLRGQGISTSVAVALAESGGRADASNTNSNGSIDRGLWQINSVHGKLSTFNVAGNADAMAKISQRGRKWTDWVTYNTGAYRSFMGRAATAAGHPSGSSGSSFSIKQPISVGASHTRAGLLDDAFSSAFERGRAGQRRSRWNLIGELGEAVRGVQTTRDVTVKGASRRSAAAAAGGKGGTTTMDGKPVANWIVPILRWAKGHGWSGSVSSGYRTPAQQMSAAKHYGLQHYGPAGPLGSNHVKTAYPGGAVDVSGASQLNSVLGGYRRKPTLKWAGPTIGDWVHFSANGHRRGGRVGRYRSGGLVATGQSSQPRTTHPPAPTIAPLSAVLTGGLERLVATVAGETSARLERLRRQLIAKAQQGGDAKVVARMQAAISAIESALGARAGRIARVADTAIARADKMATGTDRSLRRQGIDASSSAGLSVTALSDAQGIVMRQAAAAQLKRAIGAAKRSGQGDTVRDLQSSLAEVRDSINEAMTVQIERGRDIIKAFAQERVDTAQYGLDIAGSQQQGFEIQQRLAGTQDTAQGMTERATMIQTTALPAMQNQLAALQGQYNAATATGDTAGARAADLAIRQTANDIASAMADAADLIKEAGAKAAQDLVDTASYNLQVAQSGTSMLDVQQRLAGTTDTAGGMRDHAAAIEATVIPAIKAEQEALQHQMEVAAAAGDTAGWRAADLAVRQAGIDLATAMADAADLLKQAAIKAAQDVVDTADFNLSMVQGGIDRLAVDQRLAGTGDTPAAMNAQAAAIQATLIPALQAQMQALQSQLDVATSQSDTAGIRQDQLAIQQASTAIATAMADAADLIKQASIKAAQDVVDTADFGVSMAQGGIDQLTATQRLAGTTDTPGAMNAQAAAIQATVIPALQAQLQALQGQLSVATALGDTAGIRQAQLAVQQAGTAIATAMADAGDLLKQAAVKAGQDLVDAAQYGVQMAQNLMDQLEVSQSSGNTDQDPQAMINRAEAMQSTVIPALQDAYNAAANMLTIAQQQGDVASIHQAQLDLGQAAGSLSAAVKNAADLLRQGKLGLAALNVELASHQANHLQAGQQLLELDQRIAGTYDSGASFRADYITDTLIPALNVELDALQKQAVVAAQQGDPALARQVAEAIDGKNIEIKQAILDSRDLLGDVANNTGHKVGGSLGFSYGDETITDALLAVGNGG